MNSTNIYKQGQYIKPQQVRRYQNSQQLQNPVYMRKPLNYVDQYTNDRIPLNYQQHIQQSTIDRLHEESNPTQFFNNPEYSSQDLFLRNQIPNQEEAVIKQKIDNEWNIRTQNVTINIDSRARDFLTEDYENFLEDDRNEVSIQGMWLSSYIFPNNFKVNFNKQYANIKTVKLTSAIFPNTRSRTIMYIDDTNDHFFVSMVMKCPWLSYNFHIDQTTNLFDFQNFAFSVSNTYINLYKFFQEIEKPYGIPRNISDNTINNYPVTNIDLFTYNYSFENFTSTEDWSWNGNHTFNLSINHNNNVQFFATTQSPIIFDSGKNYNCSFNIETSVVNSSLTSKEPFDRYIIEHFCEHTYIDLSYTLYTLYTTYSVSFKHNFPEFLSISLVTSIPDELEDNVIYILGQIDPNQENVIIPVEDVIQNGLTIGFNRNTFIQLRAYSYTIQYIFEVHETSDIVYTNTLNVIYNFQYYNITQSIITGNISNITSASETNYFLMNGIINGQIYFNNVNLANMICSVVNAEWESENKTHIDTLQGYTTDIIRMSTEFGWQNYMQVGGKVNYITMSAGVMNNINFYSIDDNTTKYYGTYIQGVPSIAGNSLSHLSQYITRAIRDYFNKNNLDYSTFSWEYTNDLFMSDETKTRINIPYGNYTLDELINIISQQPIKIKSAKNIITSVDGIDYIENVKDNSRFYFFTVVQFQCKFIVTTEYYKNSYLLKFEVDNTSIQTLEEPISLSAYNYTYTFTPATVMYDIVCLHLSKYNVTGETILQDFFTLDPFYYHQETTPEISHVQNIKNPEYTKYNYSYNVSQIILNDALTPLTFYPAPLNMYNPVYVFPVNCFIKITPATAMYGDVNNQKDRFRFYKIVPDLPEGFELNGSTITGTSDKPFESIHYVYFYYYSGEDFQYYQQIKLINTSFTYNYSTVKLLNGYRFQGIEQLKIDSNIIATPYTNISVQLDKNWINLSNQLNYHNNNIINIGAGINIGYLTGDIYGTPQSEFQMTLNLTAQYNYNYYGIVDVGIMLIYYPNTNSNSDVIDSNSDIINSNSNDIIDSSVNTNTTRFMLQNINTSVENATDETNVLNGINNTVNGVNNVVTGDNNVITGDSNEISGNQNKLSGDNNLVYGEVNVVTRDNNVVTGDSNEIGGDNNKLSGNSNLVYGEVNEVTGDNNKLISNNNLVNGNKNIINSGVNNFSDYNNVVNGDNNNINGYSNKVTNNENTVNGNNNEVTGNINDINGDNNIVNGNQNIINNCDNNEVTGNNNVIYNGYGNIINGDNNVVYNNIQYTLLTSSNAYIQSTSVDLYSVNADNFYGDNSFMVYAYNYVTDLDTNIPQFVCWAKPIKNEINNFISFHIFAEDVVSTKLLDELHFSYTNSKDLVQTKYLIDYYKPTQVLTLEQTQLPSIRSWTTSDYTESIINAQYTNTTLLDYYSIAENAVIYPLRHTTFGYATSTTRDINLYKYNTESIDFNPESNDILSRIWYAIPMYVKNELNGYIFSQYYITNWVTSEIIDGLDCRLYYPEGSFSIQPITDVVDRIDPTATQYANIIDISTALTDNIDSSNVNLYKYCLYNRCKMDYDIIYNPVNLNTTLYNNITVPDSYSNNNLLGVQIASKVNKIKPIVDEILSEYDYYNFEDFIWIQLYSDNYGEFENIFDPLTNRWYFAKIFFKRCEKRNDVSYNYFECPLYLCKNLNYIQELNQLQVRIYDKYGKLYNDYNSTHYNFSFTLDIEYFIDDIRANGLSSRRPTQDNVMYSEELMAMQRMTGRK